MISSIMIMNLRGDVLVFRDYKDDVKRTEFTEFSSQLISSKIQKESPVIYHNGTSYLFIKNKDLFLICSTKTNPDAAIVFQFLFTFLNICKAYFATELNDATVRKNFVLIYELLDEIMDYGIPQITETESLKRYIIEGGLKLENLSDFEKLKQITMQATGANAWRPEGIVYKKNNIWVDVIETVNFTFSKVGTVIQGNVIGQVNIKCELSGMPECKFGLNDKLMLQREGDGGSIGVSLNDIKLHQCVKLSKFDKERAITFVPPDGEFVLMHYRLSEGINAPFRLMCVHGISKKSAETKMEFKLKLKAEFEEAFMAQDIVIDIPVPEGVIGHNINVGVGKARYFPENNTVTWRLKTFQGAKEALLRVDIDLPRDWNETEWGKSPIRLSGTVPSLTASGVKVRYLKVVEKTGYRTFKWIRSLTKTGEYLHRI